MKRRNRDLVHFTFYILHFTFAIAFARECDGAKYLAFAWEFQEHGPKELLAVADQFAQTSLDGVGLYLYGRNPDGKRISSYTICQEPRWEWSAFADQIPDFRSLVAKPGFRESFFVSYRAPNRRVDWTDDAGWGTIAHNMGMLARLAKACGVKGLSVDHEDYRRQNQYVRQDGDPPYAECRQLARRRGREVFGAAFREYPEVIVLSFWILTEDRSYYTVSDPDVLRTAKQDLWPDFVAGILDVLPPTARLIEGDEHAYRYEHANHDFHAGVAQLARMGQTLLPEELRSKFRARVEQSFGQYLDAYVNPYDPAKRALWSLGPEGGSRVEHFRRNLTEATSLASEYVWLWGEHNPWVVWPEKCRPHRKIRYDRTWNDELPGLYEMMAVAKAEDAGEWVRFAQLRTAGALKSLVAADTRFGTWQSANDIRGKPVSQKGTFRQEGGILAVESVARGCFILEKVSAVEAGERYAIIVQARGVKPSGQVVWRDRLGVRHGAPRPPLVFGEAMRDGWREARVLATVPTGAEHFDITLGAHQQPGERTEYRNLAVYRLWPSTP